MVKTKIICTLGPASSIKTVLDKMMLVGMDVGRLNFFHSESQELLNIIGLIRLLNKKYSRRIKFLGDLRGHRIRVGDLIAPILLQKNQIVQLTQQKIKGSNENIPFNYQGPLRAIENGQQIFIDDGNIALEVIGQIKDVLKIKVVFGGLLKRHKGIKNNE